MTEIVTNPGTPAPARRRRGRAALLALVLALGVGTTALISQAVGRKDQPHAELVFNQSCAMSIWIALALGVVGFFSMDVYVTSLSADPATAALAKSYLLWFLPAMLLQFPLPDESSTLTAISLADASSIRLPCSIVRTPACAARVIACGV